MPTRIIALRRPRSIRAGPNHRVCPARTANAGDAALAGRVLGCLERRPPLSFRVAVHTDARDVDRGDRLAEHALPVAGGLPPALVQTLRGLLDGRSARPPDIADVLA